MKYSVLLLAVPGLVLAGLTACGPAHPPPDAKPSASPAIRGERIVSLAEQQAAEQAAKATSAPVPAVISTTNETAKPTPAAAPVPAASPVPVATAKVEAATGAKPAVPNVPALTPEAPVATAKTNAEPAAELIDGQFLSVGFEKLASFEYEVPEEELDPDKKPNPKKQPDQIPPAVKSFDKKRVALKGFMLPLKVEEGLITELLVMRDQSMCCYGTVPKINEWVSVKMTGKGIKPIMDQAVTLYGRLHVGEIRENGYLVGIYAMDGEKMTGPLDL